MKTRTIFFNSDGDFINEELDPNYGDDYVYYVNLDKIDTGSRQHLISELAEFRPAGIPYTLSNSITGGASVNGPGSGYILSDDKFANSSLISQWTSSEFISLWKNNVDQVFTTLTGRPFDNIENSPDKKTMRLLQSELPNDWLFRQFNSKDVRDIWGNNPLSGDNTCTHINLVGWGRGAVSCHMLANLMKGDSEFSNLPVNILAIDPVTGTAAPEPDQTTLGSNVKEYVGFYARDERSASLPCIVPDTASNTPIHIYPIAGRHTTLIGNQAADGENKPGTFSEPADLVFYLALRCLRRWDPENYPSYKSYNGYPSLTYTSNANQVLAKMKNEYDDYVNMRNTTYSNQSKETKNDREILLNGQLTNFKSAQGARFTPSQGLAKGHIEDISYFKDIF
jgi:hypothetical protein